MVSTENDLTGHARRLGLAGLMTFAVIGLLSGSRQVRRSACPRLRWSPVWERYWRGSEDDALGRSG
jgi:hypothetical protein